MKIILQISKIILLLLVVSILSIISVSCEQSQSINTPPNSTPPKINNVTFTVSAGGFMTQAPEIVPVTVNDNDTLKVIFSVKGGGNDIDFSIKDPAGKYIFSPLKISEEFSHSFPNSIAGTYQLIFENNYSFFNNKTIDLTTLIYSAQ